MKYLTKARIINLILICLFSVCMFLEIEAEITAERKTIGLGESIRQALEHDQKVTVSWNAPATELIRYFMSDKGESKNANDLFSAYTISGWISFDNKKPEHTFQISINDGRLDAVLFELSGYLKEQMICFETEKTDGKQYVIHVPSVKNIFDLMDQIRLIKGSHSITIDKTSFELPITIQFLNEYRTNAIILHQNAIELKESDITGWWSLLQHTDF